MINGKTKQRNGRKNHAYTNLGEINNQMYRSALRYLPINWEEEPNNIYTNPATRLTSLNYI